MRAALFPESSHPEDLARSACDIVRDASLQRAVAEQKAIDIGMARAVANAGAKHTYGPYDLASRRISVSAVPAFQLPTSLKREAITDRDIHEPSPPSPHDNISRWGVMTSCHVSAKASYTIGIFGEGRS